MTGESGSRVPLVYILSNGRSGSTLLDLLLGAQRGFWTMGEVQLITWEMQDPRNLCGCGDPIQRCGFWEAALEEATLGDDHVIRRFRESPGSGKAIRPRELIPLYLDFPTKCSQASEKMVTYGQANSRLLSSVLRHAEKETGNEVRWLVDASKDPYRLLWLARSGRFDLRVLHITKDPRSFVYSMTKGSNGTYQGPLSKTLRMALRWRIENAIMLKVCREAIPVSNWSTLRYQDVAERPAETLDSVTDEIGIKLSEKVTPKIRAYTNHAVSGNKMRWGDTEIHYDDKWMSRFPERIQRLVWTLNRGLATHLGYHP